MKLVYCHNFYRLPGGEDEVFRAESKLMEERGHDVVRFIKKNASLETQSKWALAKSTTWNRNTYDEIVRLVKRFKPDIAHFTNTMPLISPAAYWAFQDNGVKVVQSLHNFRIICPGSLLVRNGKHCEKCVGKRFPLAGVVNGCYRNSRIATAAVAWRNYYHQRIKTWQEKVDRYIALSNFSKEVFLRGGIPADKLVVKPNFVMPSKWVDEQVEKENYAVFVGRLSIEKGVDVLLDAWKQNNFQHRLKIVGSGPLESLVQKAAQESNGRIEWLGQLENEKVIEILAKARLTLVTSTSAETFGRTVIESYAVGTPVIASDIGSIAENVRHGESGWLVSAGEADQLAHRLLSVWDDTDLLLDCGSNAKKLFREKFTADRNYDVLKQIYQTTLGPKELQAQGATVDVSAGTGQIAGKLEKHTPWPKKLNLFGLHVSSTDYSQAVNAIDSAVRRKQNAAVSCHAAHAVVTFSGNSDWKSRLNRFDMITPDGQPVRWALNLLHGAKLRDRVYGPELMVRVCKMAEEKGHSIFLFGATNETLEQLNDQLLKKFPGLKIAGTLSPPFGAWEDADHENYIHQINQSQADILFVGLGCPKQDLFVARNRNSLNQVQICVGAAFDFIAGVKPFAPRWMQRSGLEWLFRLGCEPRRLFSRYFVTNSQFVWRLTKQFFFPASFLTPQTLSCTKDEQTQ